MLWPRLWPGWFECSWSWKDSDNGTVCSASLWHCGTTSWGLAGQQAHGIFRSSLCTRQILNDISTVWKRHVCCRAVQLLFPSVSWYPAEPGAQEPARVRAAGQEPGLVLPTPGCVLGGRTHQLCGPCAQYSTRLDQISVVTNLAPSWLRGLLTPVVQKKDKRMRLLDRLLTAELPVLKFGNIVFLEQQLPELAYPWEQQFAFLASVYKEAGFTGSPSIHICLHPSHMIVRLSSFQTLCLEGTKSQSY